MDFTPNSLCPKTGNGSGPAWATGDTQQTLSPMYSTCLNTSLLIWTHSHHSFVSFVLGGTVSDQTGRFSCLARRVHNPPGETGCSQHRPRVKPDPLWPYGKWGPCSWSYLPAGAREDPPSDDTASLTHCLECVFWETRQRHPRKEAGYDSSICGDLSHIIEDEYRWFLLKDRT